MHELSTNHANTLGIYLFYVHEFTMVKTWYMDYGHPTIFGNPRVGYMNLILLETLNP